MERESARFIGDSCFKTTLIGGGSCFKDHILQVYPAVHKAVHILLQSLVCDNFEVCLQVFIEGGVTNECVIHRYLNLLFRLLARSKAQCCYAQC